MTTNLQKKPIQMTELYEQDYYLWMMTNANLLRNQQWELIDLEHLIEEIEDMGKEKRPELKNRLIVLLMDLLKYQYQRNKRSSSWVRTILEQRRQIQFLLEDSPSLKPYYEEIFTNCYVEAIQDASAETKLPISTFPSVCPFLPEQVINSAFILALVNQND
jgi:Domain of unknown function DUF29